MLVLMNHVGLNMHEGSSIKKLLLENYYALHGVNMFFVISGFLITTQLIQEKKRTGTIAVRRFYLRRLFRIFPVFYVYVTFVLVMNLIMHWNIPQMVFWNSYLYLTDLPFIATSYVLLHAWSLSVEEQYYLLWPNVVKKINVRWLFLIALFVCGLGMISRTLNYCWQRDLDIFIQPNVFADILTGFFRYADTLIVGSFVAWANFQFDLKSWFERKPRLVYSLLGFCVGLFVLTEFVQKHYWVGFLTVPLAPIIESLIYAFFILFTVHRSSWLSSFLNLGPLKFIGICSYSIYVWQQFFLVAINTFPGLIPAVMPQYWWSKFPVSLILVMLISVCSY